MKTLPQDCMVRAQWTRGCILHCILHNLHLTHSFQGSSSPGERSESFVKYSSYFESFNVLSPSCFSHVLLEVFFFSTSCLFYHLSNRISGSISLTKISIFFLLHMIFEFTNYFLPNEISRDLGGESSAFWERCTNRCCILIHRQRFVIYSWYYSILKSFTTVAPCFSLW